jgi:hypothetical protein
MSLSRLAQWLDSAWLRLDQRKNRPRARGRAKARLNFRPEVLWLEGRCLLSTVTNLNDSGLGSLRQAIADAPITGTVDFQTGLTGTITLTSAPLTINNVLTVAGPGASVITVSGNKARQVFTITAQSIVTISGLTIANGSTTADGVVGAGISNGGFLTMTGCILSGNSAPNAGPGGGINNTGTLSLTSCILSGNSTSFSMFGGGYGGGIYNTNMLTVDSCTFSGNSASGAGGYNGGGIYNTGTLKLTGSTFSGNSGTDGNGGGIYNTGTIQMISSSTFSNNSATSGDGGGIYNTGTIQMISSSTFSGNSTSGSGGGISNAGTLTLTSSTFSLNRAVAGAGISHSGSGTLTLTSSTLSSNFASSQGGGILHTGGGKVNVNNTVVAKNSAPSSPDIAGALNSQGYNLIGNESGGSGYANTDIHGTAAMPIDPLLDPLQGNGGSTFTAAPRAGSPALNNGDLGQLGIADQRGVVRSGGMVNIGAYQASASAFVIGVPAQATAGMPFDVNVKAVDKYDQLAIGYTGTVAFTTTDPASAVLVPSDYTFTLADVGVHSFSNGMTLFTAGPQTITASDTVNNITGSAAITVIPSTPAVDHLSVIAPGSTVVAGSSFDVVVSALDTQGQVVTGYTGTVHFSSSDPQATRPDDYTFTASDNGTHPFSKGVTLVNAGTQTITVTDTASGVTGSVTVTVNPSVAPVEHFALSAPATTRAGSSFAVVVTAVDVNGQVVIGYTGTVTLTSSDLNPHPVAYTFTASDSGTHTFSTSLFIAASQTLSVWDAGNLSIRGSATVTVQAAPASQFQVTAPSSAVAGTPFDVILTALDPYGNTDGSYQGTVHFTSSDTDAGVLLPPADYTFGAIDQGVHTFAGGFTLVTPGMQTLTATDTANAAITGSATVMVEPGMLPPPPGGGARRPDRPELSQLIAPIEAAGTPRNVSLDQRIASMDWFFASVCDKEPSFLLARRHDDRSLPESLGAIPALVV